MFNTGERQIWSKDSKKDFTYFRHIKIMQFIEKFAKRKKVIEFGSGSGYNVNYLSKSAEKVIGLEISKESVEFSKKKYKRHNSDYIVADLTKKVDLDEKFDLMYCIWVLEHIPIEKNDEFFGNAHSLLTKEGKAVICIPNGDRENKKDFPYHVQYLGYENFKKVLDKYFSEVEIYAINASNKVTSTIKSYKKTPQGKLDDFLRQADLFWILDFIPNLIKRPFRPKFKELKTDDFVIESADKDSDNFLAVVSV